MTDVVEIARKRRSRLAVEIAKLDDFIHTAELLIKYGDGFRGPILTRSDLKTDSEAAGRVDTALEVDTGKSLPQAERSVVGATKPRTNAPEAGATKEVSKDNTDGNGEAVDHFDFAGQAPTDDRELVLTDKRAPDGAEIDSSIGQKLRQRRWMTGMTKTQLAERIGGDVAEIEKYERGHASIPTGSMWKLAGALGVPTSYFFEKADAQSPDAAETRQAKSSPGPASTLAQTA